MERASEASAMSGAHPSLFRARRSGSEKLLNKLRFEAYCINNRDLPSDKENRSRSLTASVPACGLSEGAVSWLYSFSAGDALSGKDMNKMKDFLDAVQVRLSAEERDQQSLAEAELLSYGKTVFTLRAAIYDEQENLGLYCSLMGDCTLECRQDQVSDFLMTVIQMLADRNILKKDSLEQAGNLAQRAGNLVTSLVQSHGRSDPSLLLDLNYYLKLAESRFSAVESTELEIGNDECPGALLRRTWLLSEEDLLYI